MEGNPIVCVPVCLAMLKLFENVNFPIKKFMSSYNYLMCVFSGFLFFGFIHNIILYDFNSLFTEKSYDIGYCNVLMLLFHYSKYIEFMDTFFLIKQNKKVTTLQLFHHIGAPFATYSIVITKSPQGWIFLAWNSFVHRIMYFYYYLSINNIKVSWKKYLTQLQLSQFFSGMIGGYYYMQYDWFRSNKYWIYTYYINNVYVGILILLFLDFYKKIYMKKLKIN